MPLSVKQVARNRHSLSPKADLLYKLQEGYIRMLSYCSMMHISISCLNPRCDKCKRDKDQLGCVDQPGLFLTRIGGTCKLQRMSASPCPSLSPASSAASRRRGLLGARHGAAQRRSDAARRRSAAGPGTQPEAAAVPTCLVRRAQYGAAHAVAQATGQISFDDAGREFLANANNFQHRACLKVPTCGPLRCATMMRMKCWASCTVANSSVRRSCVSTMCAWETISTSRMTLCAARRHQA